MPEHVAVIFQHSCLPVFARRRFVRPETIVASFLHIIILSCLKKVTYVNPFCTNFMDMKSPFAGPGTIGGTSSVGLFLKDPNPYLASFGENQRKLRTFRSTNVTGNRTWHLLSTSFKFRITLPLVGSVKTRVPIVCLKLKIR